MHEHWPHLESKQSLCQCGGTFKPLKLSSVGTLFSLRVILRAYLNQLSCAHPESQPSSQRLLAGAPVAGGRQRGTACAGWPAEPDGVLRPVQPQSNFGYIMVQSNLVVCGTEEGGAAARS